MLYPFLHSEKNLGRAGLLLILAVLGSSAFSLILESTGFNESFAILLFWACMPFVAWFMSKAAQVQGKSRLLYGLCSLLPPLALYFVISLYIDDRIK